MPSVFAPYGFRVAQAIGAAPNVGSIREIPMFTNSAAAVYTGSLVNVQGGTGKIISATPTTTLGTTTPVGVCVGVRYVDPNGTPQHGPYIPANAVNLGYTQIYLKVVDDPNMLFQVQADAAMELADVGKNAPLLTVTAGSTRTGVSTMSLDADVATTNSLAVRIVRILDVDSDYPNVLVKFNQGVHAYHQAEGQ